METKELASYEKERLTCPICKRKSILRLRDHLRRKHKLGKEERGDILRLARGNERESIHPQHCEKTVMPINDDVRISFEDFFHMLQHLPISLEQLQKLEKYAENVRQSWALKDPSVLSPKAYKILYKAYEKFIESNVQIVFKSKS